MDSKLLRVHARRVPMTVLASARLGARYLGTIAIVLCFSNSRRLTELELFAGGPLVGANTFQATVTCALYDELFVHTGLVVCWLRGGTQLLSYGCYTLNWLDISSHQIYADLETLGPLLASSLRSDTTGFLNPRRSWTRCLTYI